LLNLNEARQLVEKIEDPITRKLVKFALGAAIAKLASREPVRSNRSVSSTDVDLLVFTEIVIGVFSRRDLLLRTLNGDVSDDWAEEF
jgi:hypothetical protein